MTPAAQGRWNYDITLRWRLGHSNSEQEGLVSPNERSDYNHVSPDYDCITLSQTRI